MDNSHKHNSTKSKSKVCLFFLHTYENLNNVVLIAERVIVYWSTIFLYYLLSVNMAARRIPKEPSVSTEDLLIGKNEGKYKQCWLLKKDRARYTSSIYKTFQVFYDSDDQLVRGYFRCVFHPNELHYIDLDSKGNSQLTRHINHYHPERKNLQKFDDEITDEAIFYKIDREDLKKIIMEATKWKNISNEELEMALPKEPTEFNAENLIENLNTRKYPFLSVSVFIPIIILFKYIYLLFFSFQWRN